MGQRIRTARMDKGYTQEYVAGALGISRQAVFKWEKDQTHPDTANLIALSELLDVSVDYLTQGTQDRRSKSPERYLRASLIPLLLLPVCWLTGVLSGVYTYMVEIPLRSGIRLGIPFLMYGPSPAAIILVTISALCLILTTVLWILSYCAYKETI